MFDPGGRATGKLNPGARPAKAKSVSPEVRVKLLTPRLQILLWLRTSRLSILLEASSTSPKLPPFWNVAVNDGTSALLLTATMVLGLVGSLLAIVKFAVLGPATDGEYSTWNGKHESGLIVTGKPPLVGVTVKRVGVVLVMAETIKFSNPVLQTFNVALVFPPTQLAGTVNVVET